MNSGFTFLEVLISIALLAFISAGSLSLYSFVAKEGDRTSTMTGRNIENEQMIEHLTQPVYFGLLAGFSENIELKKCLTADGALCSVEKDYPLTAMNLTTKQPLDLISGGMAEGVKNTLSFRVHCPLNQSACDQAEYFVVKVLTEVAKPHSAPYVIEKTAMVAPEITNVATFIPDAAMSPGRNVNVVLLLDNSTSMAAVKDNIKTGLDSLISTLASLNTRVAIYHLYARQNQLYPRFFYTVSGGVKSYIPSANVPGDLPVDTEVYGETTLGYYYRPVWPVNSTFFGMVDFKTTDDATLKATKIQAINSRIDTLFSEGSSAANDTPLCQMMHLIESTDQVIPFNKETPTVFLLLTNENDETKLISNLAGGPYTALKQNIDCYKKTIEKFKVKANPYNYYGKAQFNRFTVNAEFLSDGVLIKENKIVSVRSPVYEPTVLEGADCLSKADLLMNDIKSTLKATYNVTGNVEFTGNLTAVSCTTFLGNMYLIADYSADICAKQEATFVANYKQYIPGTCHSVGGGSSYLNFIEFDSIEPMVPWTSTTYINQDTPLAVYEKIVAKDLLKSLFFIPIIHPSTGTCPLSTGATQGTKYERLASLLGEQAEVVSVCNPDYSTKLKSLTQDFISDLGRADIEIPADVAANLKSVEVTRGTTILKPVKDVDYRVFNTTLMFTPGYLQATDIVKVFTQ